MASNSLRAASSSAGPLSQDTALPADAEDTVSSVSWSPVSNHLAVASWDGKVRIYDVAHNGSAANGVAILPADGPVFDCDWAKDGAMVLAGGADRKIHLLHAATGQQTTIGSHDAPIRGVRFVEVAGSGAPTTATGSWDRTVRFWDLRQQSPLATLPCKERVYSMDAKAHLLVIATAERHIHLVDLQKDPSTFRRTDESPLRHQTKAVTAYPDGRGWGTVSIEGRCAINALEEKDSRSINFTFRCHRGQPDARTKVSQIWSVNDVQFHPAAATIFTTAGSDGVYNFWDRVARSRLKSYPPAAAAAAATTTTDAITSTRFNRDGSLFAYAVGYDWSMGHAKNTPGIKTRLMLHRVTEEETTVRKSVRFQ